MADARSLGTLVDVGIDVKDGKELGLVGGVLGAEIFGGHEGELDAEVRAVSGALDEVHVDGLNEQLRRGLLRLGRGESGGGFLRLPPLLLGDELPLPNGDGADGGLVPLNVAEENDVGTAGHGALDLAVPAGSEVLGHLGGRDHSAAALRAVDLVLLEHGGSRLQMMLGRRARGNRAALLGGACVN